MVFQDERQRIRVCRALLASIGRESLWTENGPSDLAVEYLEKGNPLSAGEKVIFKFAWEAWGEETSLKVGDLIYRLDGNLTALVGSFILATQAGPLGVDHWLLEHEPAQA